MIKEFLDNKNLQEMALELYRERIIFPYIFLDSIKENDEEVLITFKCKKDEAGNKYYIVQAVENE